MAADGGGTIVLKPCTVDDNGKMAADQTGAKPLYLLPGTYDFYAITPAFAPDASAHTSVSVAHGDDFASSKTAGVTLKSGGGVEQPDPASGGSTISGSNGAVQLTVLGRKCARLSFTVSRKSEGIEKAKFRLLWLSKLATSPKNSVSINGDITADIDNTADQSGGGHFDFAVPTDIKEPTGTTTIPSPIEGKDPLPAFLCDVADEVLPKAAGVLNLHMEVLFNDRVDKTDADILADPSLLSVLDAELPSIAYVKDKQYNYRLILKGGIVYLELTVSNWTDLNDCSVDNLGGASQVEGIVVGTWTPCSNPNDDMGQGSASGELGSGDWMWTENQNWSVELGNYMQAVSQANGWTNNSADNPSLGNGSASGSVDGGTWTTVFDNPTDNLGDDASASAGNGGDWADVGGGDSSDLGDDASGSTGNGGNWTNNPEDDATMGNGSASGSTGNGDSWTSNPEDDATMGNGSASGSANGGDWAGVGGGDSSDLGDDASGSTGNGGNWTSNPSQGDGLGSKDEEQEVES